MPEKSYYNDHWQNFVQWSTTNGKKRQAKARAGVVSELVGQGGAGITRAGTARAQGGAICQD